MGCGVEIEDDSGDRNSEEAEETEAKNDKDAAEAIHWSTLCEDRE